MKKCNRCLLEKPLSEFHKNSSRPDGWRDECKECRAKATAIYMQSDRARELAKARQRRYYTSDKSHAKRRVYAREARKAHPLQAKARVAVSHAKRDGKLKPQPCERCGTTKRIQAHHPDYSKPLDVQWLCVEHHMEIHHGKN